MPTGSARSRRAILVAMATALVFARGSTGRAAATDEVPNCVLDTDCARGQCIDLVCVTVPGAPVDSAPEVAPLPPPAADERRAPPRKKKRRASPPDAPDTQPRHAFGAARISDVAPSQKQPGWDDASKSAPRDPEKEWYRLPLGLAYLAPPIAFALAEEPAGPTFFAVFAAPIVHWVNRNGGNGTLALFMQPVFGGIGALAGEPRNAEIAGALLGYAGWVAIDVGALAYKKSSAPSASLAVAPLSVARASGLEVVGVW